MTTRRDRSPARPPAVPAEQRELIIRKLRDGYDLEAAVVTAGVEVTAVRADDEFMVACGDAYRTGTARLRGRMLEKALAGNDVHIVERVITERAKAQQEFPAAAKVKGDDDGLAKRLSALSADELQLVEWAIDGIGERPARQLSYAEGMFLAGQRRAAERGKRADRLEVADPLTPLPRNRSIVKAPVPPPTGSAGIRDLAATDPRAAVAWLMRGSG